MNINKTTLISIFVGLIILLSGCSSIRHYSDDPFYASTGAGDSLSFPLIKPYKVTNLKMGSGWGVRLHISPAVTGIYWYLGIHDVQKIAVANDVILIYTQYKPEVDEEVGQKVLYWFVIIPHEKLEVGFDNEPDFLKYIREYGIEEPAWEDPESIFQRFKDTGCLEWIPDCK